MSATDTTRTPEPFVYRLKAVAKVVDGDTLDLDLDLGFSITLRQRVSSDIRFWFRIASLGELPA